MDRPLFQSSLLAVYAVYTLGELIMAPIQMTFVACSRTPVALDWWFRRKPVEKVTAERTG